LKNTVVVFFNDILVIWQPLRFISKAMVITQRFFSFSCHVADCEMIHIHRTVFAERSKNALEKIAF
jgi:hypothetical protein